MKQAACPGDEAKYSSETQVDFQQTTWRYIPGGRNYQIGFPLQ
jgi:hypothetical protein